MPSVHLLREKISDALDSIWQKLGGTLHEVKGPSSMRSHRTSDHVRAVSAGMSYAKDITCHHLMLEFSGMKRHT